MNGLPEDVVRSLERGELPAAPMAMPTQALQGAGLFARLRRLWRRPAHVVEP